MPRPFFSATAEQVLYVVGAVVARQQDAEPAFIAQFCDLPEDRAEKALDLAVDLGFLQKRESKYSVGSPLCRFLRTPSAEQRAAVLRVMLESYEPFIIFRQGIDDWGSAQTAAQQTIALLDLAIHREDLKDTLINLATFSGALKAGSGGSYQRDDASINGVFDRLAQECTDLATTEYKIRSTLGAKVAAAVSHANVIAPLGAGLRYAIARQPREAVLNAGNAVDSFLDEYAAAVTVALGGATGINSKLEKLAAGGRLPKKLVFKGKYLGYIRNAADHGVDADVGAAWQITEQTGQHYVFVACSFVASVLALTDGAFEI
jgi:hypothetical protein